MRSCRARKEDVKEMRVEERVDQSDCALWCKAIEMRLMSCEAFERQKRRREDENSMTNHKLGTDSRRNALSEAWAWGRLKGLFD